MEQYKHLSFSELVTKLNELSDKIDSLDERHKFPFFYKTYEMREQQWNIRQTLVAEFNPMFREYKRRRKRNEQKTT
jgi:hypothetical protein